MESDPDWIPTFAPSGTILQEGQWISRRNLSRTLYTIAEEGADAFYTVRPALNAIFVYLAFNRPWTHCINAATPQGPIAESLVAKIRETGGVMTLTDLAAYRVHVHKAIEGSYRGKRVFTTRPPTSGVVLLHILNLLERYNLPAEGLTPLNLHRVVEALKCT